MDDRKKLIIVKWLHTAVRVVFVTMIFYVLYSGVTNDINRWTWISIGAVVAEGIVLAIFGMYCPLTLIARRYSDSEKDNFDIYLPNWLARHNKTIFTSLFILSLAIIICRLV